MMISRWSRALVLPLVAAVTLPAQNSTPFSSNFDFRSGASAWPNISKVYETPEVAPLTMDDSVRLDRLISGGKLYLSLNDAIALALENNLDIVYARYEPLKADTDILRAKSGAQLRGIQTQISTLSTGQSSGVGGVSGGGGGNQGGGGDITGVDSSGGQNNSSSGVGSASSFFGSQSVSLDPMLFGGINWGHFSAPQTSNFVTGTNTVITESSNSQLGFQQGFVSGAQATLRWQNYLQDSNQLKLNFNPSLRSSMTLVVSQPLLQGFGRSVNARQIRVARNNREISDLTFKQQVISVVSRVQLLYWDLVTLRLMVDARREDLRLSQQLYDDNKLRVQIGTLAPVDLTRSEGEVAQRRQEFTLAESRVKRQEVTLKNALSANGLASAYLTDVEIIPTNGLSEVPKVEEIQPLQDLMTMALQTRPEMASMRIQLTNTDIDLKAIRNAMLPEVNVFGALTNNGLAGTFNDTGDGGTVSNYFLGGLGTSLGQVFRRNFPDYQFGVEVTIPLRNRRAQADMAASLLERRQQDIRYRQQENSLRAAVQNVVIDLQEARAQYDAAREGRILQQKTLDGLQQRFNLGRSQILDVVQAQRDLALARIQELTAHNSYIRSRVNLELVTGQTLESNHVSIDEAYSGRVSRAADPLPPNVNQP